MFVSYYPNRQAVQRTDAPALAVDNVGLSYPGVREQTLRQVSLTIPSGVRVALVGANGSGKSTLLKAAAGLIRPQQGQISIYGLPVGALPQRVAYLPQRSEIDWRFPISVERMVLAGRYVHLGWLRRPGPSDESLVAAMLERLRLSDLAKRQIGALSGGQQQRALLARALVQGADLLLLDEPLSAVDAQSRQIIAGVLDEIRREGKTALVATHHVDRLDEEFDTVIAIEDGQIVQRQQPSLLTALGALRDYDD